MSETEIELPKAVIKRLVKAKLAEKVLESSEEAKKDFQVNKDALTAFGQATKVFISYVASAANDICKENKRSTVSANDILKALEELEFESFLPDVKSLATSLSTKRKASADNEGTGKKAAKRAADPASTTEAAGSAEQDADTMEEDGAGTEADLLKSSGDVNAETAAPPPESDAAT